jgi:hypothetical protein
MSMKISYSNVLPIAGVIIGITVAVSYYLGIMIPQLFIGRPSLTWILGIFWLPVLVVKPGLVGGLLGSIVWLFIRPFRQPRSLTTSEIRAIKLLLELSITNE